MVPYKSWKRNDIAQGKHTNPTHHVKGDFNLGHPSGRRGHRYRKSAKKQILARHRSFAFKHLRQRNWRDEGDNNTNLDEEACLIVRVGAEALTLFAGQRGVAVDDVGHDTASGLEAERERGNGHQDQSLGLLLRRTAHDCPLDGTADGGGLVGVKRFVRVLAVEELIYEFLHFRNAAAASDQQYLQNDGSLSQKKHKTFRCTSSMSDLLIFESFSACSIGISVFRK